MAQRRTAGGVVVITGASSGMGENCAHHLNARGYDVFAGVLDDSEGDRLVADARRPQAMFPVRLDVTSDADVGAARAAVEDRLGATGGRLAGLFSNAGIAGYSADVSCEGTSMADLERMMAVDFTGGVRFVQAFLPLLRASRGAVAINSALMARTVIPFNGGYASAKAALEAWADSLRREAGPLGVRVSLIEAAAIATRLGRRQHPDRIPTDTPYRAMAPLGRFFLDSQRTIERRRAADPRRVSEIVATIIEHERPKPRYRVGVGARPIWMLGRLPDRVQDRLFELLLGRLARSAGPHPAGAPAHEAESRRHSSVA